MSQEWLPAATRDARTAARYWAKVHRLDDGCWLWTGAISGRGHGRFWVAQGQCAIAHRFGWALAHPNEPMPAQLAHRCDNPLCQNPDHLTPSSPGENRRDWVRRREVIGGPLRDERGARGRARAIRDAARIAGDVDAASTAGVPAIDRDQGVLW